MIIICYDELSQIKEEVRLIIEKVIPSYTHTHHILTNSIINQIKSIIIINSIKIQRETFV